MPDQSRGRAVSPSTTPHRMPAVLTVTLSPDPARTPAPAKDHPHREWRTRPHSSSPGLTSNTRSPPTTEPEPPPSNRGVPHLAPTHPASVPRLSIGNPGTRRRLPPLPAPHPSPWRGPAPRKEHPDVHPPMVPHRRGTADRRTRDGQPRAAHHPRPGPRR